MRQQFHNKCVEVNHWLKKHVCILREFLIFLGGFKCFRFAVEAGSMETLHAGKWFNLIFDAPIVPSSRYYIVAVKKITTGISFVSSIGPSHPISEITFSHVYRLKKTRNEGDRKTRVFLIKRERTQCHITWVSSDWVVAVR